MTTLRRILGLFVVVFCVSALVARAQANGVEVIPIGGPPTYLLPDPLGSDSGATTIHGVTLHVCPTCQYTSALAAISAYAGTSVDVTLIDEVRGDNITQGEDIFAAVAHLHFKGAGTGTAAGTVIPFIIDYPIHLGPQSSIEGVGDCAGSGATGCTAFILEGTAHDPIPGTFPAGTAAPTTTPIPTDVSCSSGLPGGMWTVGVGLSTDSGPTQSAPTQTIPITGGDCLQVTEPGGTSGGAEPIRWTVFVADPLSTTTPRWQATLDSSTGSYTVSGSNYVKTTNPAPTFNLSQVGITLGTTTNTVGADLAGKLSTGILARDFTLNGNGAQTCIAVTTAQNQSVLSNVNVGNCGSVTKVGSSGSCVLAPPWVIAPYVPTLQTRPHSGFWARPAPRGNHAEGTTIFSRAG